MVYVKMIIPLTEIGLGITFFPLNIWCIIICKSLFIYAYYIWYYFLAFLGIVETAVVLKVGDKTKAYVNIENYVHQ
jgi:hypothetical protein